MKMISAVRRVENPQAVGNINFQNKNTMNKIEQLPKTIIVDGIGYTLEVHITSWDRFCIQYEKMIDPGHILCAVVVEEENAPKTIEDAFKFQSFNRGIGNARTFDDAIDMLLEFITPLMEKDEYEE